jgi:PAS domain S-box-containing protein
VTREEQRLKLIEDHLIYTETNLKGIVTYATQAFCDISGYSKEELIGKPHNIVRHRDMPQKAFKDMWDTIKKGEDWKGEIKNRNKNGEYCWLRTTISPLYDDNEIVGYGSSRHDITKVKNELFSSNSIFNVQNSIVVVTEGVNIININDNFFKIFNFNDFNDFTSKHKCICELFKSQLNLPHLMPIMDGMNWVEYIKNNPDKVHEAYMEDKDGEELIFEVHIATQEFERHKEEILVFIDVTAIMNHLNDIEDKNSTIKALINNIEAFFLDDNFDKEKFKKVIEETKKESGIVNRDSDFKIELWQ